MNILTLCNTIAFLFSILFAFAVSPAIAATPADFAGTWSCLWEMKFNSTITVVAGDKIDVTHTWKANFQGWGVCNDGEVKVEGAMTPDEKLQFEFKYAPTNDVPTKIILSVDGEEILAGKHVNPRGTYWGKCKKQ